LTGSKRACPEPPIPLPELLPLPKPEPPLSLLETGGIAPRSTAG